MVGFIIFVVCTLSFIVGMSCVPAPEQNNGGWGDNLELPEWEPEPEGELVA